MIEIDDALPPGVTTAADLMRHYKELRHRLRQQLAKRRGPPVVLPAPPAAKTAAVAEPAPVEPELASALDPGLTFERFLTGDCNRLAHAAAQAVAAAPAGGPTFNPLFVHAGVALGKTHLLQATVAAARERGRRVLYLSAERFACGALLDTRRSEGHAFRERLRATDLLAIDDVHLLRGRLVHDALASAISALSHDGRQVVLAADRAPGEMEGFDERLTSRLRGGLVVEMAPLDAATRMGLIAAHCAEIARRDDGFDVPRDVIAFICEHCGTGGRDIAGAVNRLLAHHQTGREITLDMAEEALRGLLRNEPPRVRVDDILRVVARHYSVTRADILSQRRTANVVRPRQMAMYLAKTLTLRSLPEIGRRFGGRDHTTVLHAVRKIDGLVARDADVAAEARALTEMIREGGA